MVADMGAPNPGGPILGIDLGMTSIIAAWVPGPGEPPQVIPIDKHGASLPAVVGYTRGERPALGRAAREMVTTSPERAITGIKRLLGRKADSHAVKDLANRVGYTVVAGRDGEAQVELDGRPTPVPEIAAVLLDHVRRAAEAHLEQPVHRCVIAVPAYFNEPQKAAVRAAADRAGLEVAKLVHEPTAVTLAYGFNQGAEARVVIVDMGGVRLDVSVMEIAGNVFDVVSTGGDPYLGGTNVDALLSDWILAGIARRHGMDLREHPRLLQKVRTAAEQAKRELGRCRAVDLQIPLDADGRDKNRVGQLRLHANTLEELAAPVVDRVLDTVQRTLADRGLEAQDVDEVLLVGGATRMPLVKSSIEAWFGRPARDSIAPEHVVALGAALLADSLRSTRARTDAVQAPIGIALADGRLMRIIDKDSQLPMTRRVIIPTVRDRQRTLELDVFEGEANDILDATYLGTIVFPAIPDASAGEAKLMVDLAVEEDRMLRIRSPEPGREEERFEFAVLGHPTRDSRPPAAPRFEVAQALPLPAGQT